MNHENPMRIILHAPSPNSLERARNNAANIMREAPGTQVRVIANAHAVHAALDIVHESLDSVTWLCPISLARAERESRSPLNLISGPAVLEIARLQHEGWIYIRA